MKSIEIDNRYIEWIKSKQKWVIWKELINIKID